MIKSDVLESMIDVGSGFFLSIIIQLTIFPLFDLKSILLNKSNSLLFKNSSTEYEV